MTSVKLKVKDYKETVKNKQLVEIINKIIFSFPLTFINLERIRKDIDSVNELFWIKDDGGKYLIVNNKFASCFHLTPSQIEGKPVNKFIPSYLINFNKALDEYIKESRSVFIIEGFPLSGIPAGENYQTIEIPVAGSEGSLNAIIGIAQKSDLNERQINLSSSLNLLKPFIKSYILIDNEEKIKDVSEEFCNTFSLQSTELYGNNFFETLPVLISRIIDEFNKSGQSSQVVNLKNSGMWDKEFHLHLFKDEDWEKLIIIESEKFAEQPIADTSNKIINDYDFIIHTNPEPSFIYDKENLKFLQVNNAALNLYGYRKEEFLDLDLTDLYSPEDIQTLLEASEEKFKEGLFSKPFRQIKKDGTNVFIEINRVSILYKEKESYLNIVKNITDKLKLDEESQLFRSIFNNSNNLIFITDTDGFIKSINSSVTETLGYSEKSLMETSLTALVRNEDRGKINSSVFQSGLKEKTIIETSLKKAGNDLIQVKLIAVPVFNYNNEVKSYNIICAEKPKEIIKEVLKEIPVETEPGSKIVSTDIPEINFLSGIFHDLLTPINVILGFVSELTQNADQPINEQKEAVEIINSNRINLLESMNEVMEFIRIENKQAELKYNSVKIIEIIEAVKSNFEKKKSGEVKISFGKISSSLEVRTDEQKLHRLLTLLVQLIIKITEEKKIYISASTVNEQHFFISFKDEYNISTKNFFEKLSRALSDDYTISAKYSGVSFLNFKLCKSILKLLGGELKMVDEKNKKEMVFIFPLNLEEQKDKTEFEVTSEEFVKETKVLANSMIEPEEKNEPETIKNSKDVYEGKDGIDLSQLSCLYIEDQLDSQMLFSSQMKDLRQINFAVSFEHALPLLHESNFDFIVVDINLQGDYNGLDILKIIRTMPDYENIPVIAVSAYLLSGNKDNFIRAGFNDFISKPVFREKLINSLEKIFLIHS